MNPIVIIPARLAATRFPEKPLASIAGKPMVVRVLEAGIAAAVGPVIVACDDVRIAKVVSDAGGQFVMTDPDLPSGSDRVAAAVDIWDPTGRHDVVINLQGDLPAFDPTYLTACLTALKNPHVSVGTLAVPLLGDQEKIMNPHVAKVALVDDLDGGNDSARQISRALYFSRSVIPHGSNHFYQHIGVYAYRRAALNHFVASSVTDLELIEKLEQLRLLALGLRIDVHLVKTAPLEVNVPADLDAVSAFFH